MQPRNSVFSLDLESLAGLSDRLTALVRGRLWLQVLIGMVLGIATGILLGPSTGWLTPDTALALGNWLALPGQLFLTLIQMIVIPLVFASVIRGLAASENLEQLRTVGVRVTLYFLLTTAVAIVIGLQLALIIEPGGYVDRSLIQQTVAQVPPPAAAEVARPNAADIPGHLAGLLPRNPLSSMVEGQMLQVVLFAVVFGVALVMMAPAQAKPLLDLLGSLQEVCMTVVRWAMLLAPIAVFGLLAQLSSKIGLEALLGMAVYVATVLLGLAVLLVLYLVLLWLFGAITPGRFLGASRDVLLLAFSTSSSAAVMPLTMKTAEQKLQVRSSVAQFVIPLGATINMNGTALYQGVAAVFLAQVYGIELTAASMALIVVTAVGASVGSPATPGVGIVILAMVLDSVGIPAAGIALILGVDRILDMARTAINVCGDLVAARIMDRWLGQSPTQVAQPIPTDT